MQKITLKTCVRFLIPVGLVLAALLPAAEARAEDHVRDGWFIGMGYGYGRGVLTASNDQAYSYRDGATPQIRFGHSVGQHFLAGIEYGGWMFEEGDVDQKFRWSLQSVTGAVTWHPGPVDGYWGGLYARAGVGLAWASGARVELEDQEQVHFDRLDETGLGLVFSLGYEFRISGSAAAGLSVGFNHLDIGKQLYNQARYVPVAMTMNWYWN
jgi:hypothetical protein